MMKSLKVYNNGFSLVELAVVLIVIGLLVGGVLVGQSLIAQAELHSITKELNEYKVAASVFQGKYDTIPGDMINATDYWGETASCPDTAGTGSQTCNGDGDGYVDNGIIGNADEYTEAFMFWQHLANAELIDGDYTGIAGANSAGQEPTEENTPNSSFPGGSWYARVMAPEGPLVTDYYFKHPGQNWLTYGERTGPSNLVTILTPAQAWQIDQKIDDEKPGTGQVISFPRNRDCADATSHTDYEADYVLTEEDTTCALMFPSPNF